jgi:hypothetical protein
MTKLHQLHDRYGQSPWLDNATRGDVTGDHPVWHRSETDVFPGQHDEREER